MLKRSRRWYWQMTKVRVCVSDEAFYYPTGIDGWPGCSAYSFSLSASASKLARPAPAAVTFGWLAAERLWPTRREPGTLITALTLSQLSAAPLCCHHHRAKKRLLLFHTHLLVLSSSSSRLVFPAFRLFSATLSPLALLFLYRFACPQLSAFCLCAHVACCQLSAARGCLPCPISIYLFPRPFSYHLSPSRLRLPSQRVS